MPHVQNDDVNIAYEVHGAGTPIVLLMGLGLPGMVWGDLTDQLVEHGFQVIVPDNRGTGRSDAPLPPYSMAEMAEDVALVMDDVGVDKAIVLGVSFGGMLAQHVALEYPERVCGLLLASTTCGLNTGRWPRPTAIWLLLKMMFASAAVTFDEAQKLLAHPESTEETREFLQFSEEVREELPTPALGVLGQLLAVLLHNTGHSLTEIEVPTRIVTGDSDILIPPKNSEIMAELIPNASLHVVPKAGHIFIQEHPDSLYDNVLALREEVESDRAA